MAEAKKKAKDETLALYNANAGIHGRDGGPYLDEVEAAHWEKIHAAREGTKPDLDNPRPYPGNQLVPVNTLVANYNPTLLGGDDRRVGADFQAAISAPVLAEVPKEVIDGSGINTITETDTEDKGDEDEVILPPLFDKPEENKVSPAVITE